MSFAYTFSIKAALKISVNCRENEGYLITAKKEPHNEVLSQGSLQLVF